MYAWNDLDTLTYGDYKTEGAYLLMSEVLGRGAGIVEK